MKKAILMQYEVAAVSVDPELGRKLPRIVEASSKRKESTFLLGIVFSHGVGDT